DGRADTAWRTPGDGVGAAISIDLPAGLQIRRVGLIPGYAKTDPSDGADRFAENRRVTVVRWRFSDGTSIEQSFRDDRAMQVIDVVAPGGPVVVEILGSTAPGGRDFTAISEIE